MFRATVIRAGKWRNNIYSEDRVYGDFQNPKGAITWVTEESEEFRGGWAVVKIVIEERRVLNNED